MQALTDWCIPAQQIEGILETYPVATSEVIREPVTRVRRKLNALAELTGIVATRTMLIVVDPDGAVRVRSLADVAEHGDIAYKLLLLPERLGNIDNGMFQSEPPVDQVPFDVADAELNRRRYRIDDNSHVRMGGNGEEANPGCTRQEFASFARTQGFRAPLVVRRPDDDREMLVYFGATVAQSSLRRQVTLSAHRSAVSRKSSEMAAACGLESLSETYECAGALHDEGKHNLLWQRAMGGNMDEPLAKVVAAVNSRLIGGYRHEFGSLVRAADHDDDLALHLIATHHAAGRPYFETHQFDRDALKQSEPIAFEQARRFARLHVRYGLWGLAYLEAVFKCADGLVSAEEGEAASD